jgi:hypothetical protein
MQRISWLFLAATSAAALSFVATAPGKSPEIRGGRCYAPGTAAKIGGRAVCLTLGAPCRTRYERQYRRYLYTCRSGVFALYWGGLRRPFHFPTISAGGDCPTSAATNKLEEFGSPYSGKGWGPGPAFPFGLSDDGGRPVFRFEYPPGPQTGWEGTGWGGSKNVWGISARYRGMILVRGQQLDGPNEVRFENGRPGFTRESGLHPQRELRLLGPEIHGNPSVTRLRAAGCYAFQVDGRGFSYLIVFEARIVS